MQGVKRSNKTHKSCKKIASSLIFNPCCCLINLKPKLWDVLELQLVNPWSFDAGQIKINQAYGKLN